MASTAAKWAIGCGIGCVVIILIVVAVFGGMAFWFKDMAEDFQAAQVAQHDLQARYGDVAAFVPPPDGAIPPERMEAFLAVRDVLVVEGQPLAESLETLSRANDDEGDGGPGALSVMGAVGGLLPRIGGYLGVRAQTLMAHDMGPGEYAYIHTVAYHGWLGHDPLDGPEGEPDAVQYEFSSGDEGMRVRRSTTTVDTGMFGKEDSERRYRALVVTLLGNQRDAITDDTPDAAALRDVLAAEIAAIESGERLAPWGAAMPDAISASLEPYRERLEATYVPMLNLFDVIQMNDIGMEDVTE